MMLEAAVTAIGALSQHTALVTCYIIMIIIIIIDNYYYYYHYQ